MHDGRVVADDEGVRQRSDRRIGRTTADRREIVVDRRVPCSAASARRNPMARFHAMAVRVPGTATTTPIASVRRDAGGLEAVAVIERSYRTAFVQPKSRRVGGIRSRTRRSTRSRETHGGTAPSQPGPPPVRNRPRGNRRNRQFPFAAASAILLALIVEGCTRRSRPAPPAADAPEPRRHGPPGPIHAALPAGAVNRRGEPDPE